MRVRRVFVGFAAASLTACNALLALEPLQFEAAEAGAGDAGVADGAATDVTGDRGVVNDAGDASVASFCSSSTSDFCDDFEGTRTVQGAWNGFVVTGTGSASIEGGTFVTDVRPMDGSVPVTAGAALSLDQPWLEDGGGARARIHVTFRAFVEECPLAGETAAVLVSMGLNGKAVDLTIDRQAGDCVARIREIVFEPIGYRASTTLLVQVGGWNSFDFDLPEPAPGTGGQAILGVAGTGTATLDLTETKAPARFYTLLGVTQGTLYGVTARVRFDDVRIDYRN